MPELSKVMTKTCMSNITWSREYVGSLGTTHLVTYNMQDGMQCTCKGYQYRGKCKHTDDAHGHRCGWGADAWANVIHHEDTCPLCGEETVPFYVGV